MHTIRFVLRCGGKLDLTSEDRERSKQDGGQAKRSIFKICLILESNCVEGAISN